MKKAKRTATSLSAFLEKPLNLYALGASAAFGSGLLLSSQNAEARIIYTPTHHVIDNFGAVYRVDLNHDGIADVVIGLTSSLIGTTFLAELNAAGAGNNAIVGRKFLHSTIAYALKPGAVVGGKARFVKGGIMLAATGTEKGSWTHRGPWYNVNNRYLGCKFLISGKYHYGWVRLSVALPNRSFSIKATVTGYAYETIPGKAITAGQTKELDEAVNGSLGALAAGAKALRISKTRSQFLK